MVAALKKRLNQSFALTHDLVAHLDERSLGLDLPGVPSNTMSGQLWCIVGARESYTRAIAAGGWSGFSCSLSPPLTKVSILAALRSTQDELSQLDFGRLTDVQEEFSFVLLEHEVQHHGQLIRFVYGNRLTFPASWTERYTV